MIKLLFVCMGNICRSPAAECIMRKMVLDSQHQGNIECDSCGTIDYHHGESPDSRMVQTASQFGYNIRGASRPIQSKDFENFDYIFTMDDENFENLKKMRDYSPNKVKKFCDFLTKSDASIIPDPYYGGLQGFENVIKLLEEGCAEIIRRLPNLD